MHLAIPPPNVRNPEKGFKLHPRKGEGNKHHSMEGKAHAIDSKETLSRQTTVDGTTPKSLRRSLLSGMSCPRSFCAPLIVYSIQLSHEIISNRLLTYLCSFIYQVRSSAFFFPSFHSMLFSLLKVHLLDVPSTMIYHLLFYPWTRLGSKNCRFATMA